MEIREALRERLQDAWSVGNVGAIGSLGSKRRFDRCDLTMPSLFDDTPWTLKPNPTTCAAPRSRLNRS